MNVIQVNGDVQNLKENAEKNGIVVQDGVSKPVSS